MLCHGDIYIIRTLSLGAKHQNTMPRLQFGISHQFGAPRQHTSDRTLVYWNSKLPALTSIPTTAKNSINKRPDDTLPKEQQIRIHIVNPIPIQIPIPTQTPLKKKTKQKQNESKKKERTE